MFAMRNRDTKTQESKPGQAEFRGAEFQEATSGDSSALRGALGKFATGVTVITTCDSSGALQGLTANSFGSLSLDPPLVQWSLQKQAQSLRQFARAEHFTVNVLSQAQRELSRHFATPSRDKFAGISYRSGLGGSPVLPDSLAVIECRSMRHIEAGDHVIFIGEVVRFLEGQGRPLIFSSGEYHQLSSLQEAH
jgi:flavin reductase (DIM6/NTAB) family NADH-FMN oxidoreductase RutF